MTVILVNPDWGVEVETHSTSYSLGTIKGSSQRVARASIIILCDDTGKVAVLKDRDGAVTVV